ncbi:MAG: 50S ribosomal protein L10 [Promethearchaeota archaeon]
MISQEEQEQRSKIPQWKIKEVNKLVDLFKKYKNVAVLIFAGINDRQVQETRKILRDKVVIKMSKKNLQIRAIEKYQKESKKKGLEELKKNIPGQTSLLFTDLDIFELKRIFEENKWMIPAKPNAITPVDIIVPAGDTGLPTGQVISELNMTLRLPTRIQNDTIWIREDKMTHKAGDFVTVKEAAVLKKLGITPLESVIKIYYAWCDGEVLPYDVIYMDLDQFQKDIESAFLDAKKLAIELNFIDIETVDVLVQKGFRESLALLFEMPIFDTHMTGEYIKRAVINANTINAMIFGEGFTVIPVQEQEEKERKEDKMEKEKKGDEEDEEDEPAGIASLF